MLRTRTTLTLAMPLTGERSGYYNYAFTPAAKGFHTLEFPTIDAREHGFVPGFTIASVAYHHHPPSAAAPYGTVSISILEPPETPHPAGSRHPDLALLTKAMLSDSTKHLSGIVGHEAFFDAGNAPGGLRALLPGWKDPKRRPTIGFVAQALEREIHDYYQRPKQ